MIRHTVYLTSGPPYPLIGARRIRDAQLIHLLSQRSRVEVISLGHPPAVMPTVPENVELVFAPNDSGLLGWEGWEWWKPHAFQGRSSRVLELLKAKASPESLLWVSRLRMARYIPAARAMGYQVVLDEHQVESDAELERAFSRLTRWHHGIRAMQSAWFEKRYCGLADTVVTGAQIDAYRLQKLNPSVPVHLIPHAVQADAYAALATASGRDLLFFGDLGYGPNVAGLRWFTSEVMPRLRAALGSAMPRVVVATTEAQTADEEEVHQRELSGSGLALYRDSTELLQLLSQAAVVFFPLKSGRGNRFSILEAMAAGRPIVTTGKGADGLILKPTYDVLIAEQADAFTSAILKLLRDPSTRAEIGTHARETVVSRFDWADSLPYLDVLLEKLGDLRRTKTK